MRTRIRVSSRAIIRDQVRQGGSSGPRNIPRGLEGHCTAVPGVAIADGRPRITHVPPVPSRDDDALHCDEGSSSDTSV